MISKPLADWDAATYHRLSDPQLEWGRQVLARLELRGDETVMDAGCGTGRLTLELAERLPRGTVIAVDASPAMLEEARRHLHDYGQRVRMIQARLEDLDMPESVDVIFSNATFHWIPDHPRLFGSLHRTLRPGGRLVAQCGGGPNLSRLLARAAEIWSRPEYAPFLAGWSGPWEFADERTTAERLKAAGFVNVETSLEEWPVRFKDAETYREYIGSTVFARHLARIPEDGRQLREGFLEEMAQRAVKDQPAFTLDYWRVNMAAERAR